MNFRRTSWIIAPTQVMILTIPVFLFSVFCIPFAVSQYEQTIDSLNLTGQKQAMQGQYKEAFNNYDSALMLALEDNDQARIATLHINLGQAFFIQADYSKALKNYFSALKAFEAIRDSTGMGDAHSGLASVYFFSRELEEAKFHHETALQLFTKKGNKDRIAHTYVKLGEVLSNLCDVEEGLRYTQEGIRLGEEIGFKPAIGTGHNIVGSLYTYWEDHETALNHYLIALRVWSQEGDHDKIAASEINAGGAYYFLKRYHESMQHYKRGLAHALQLGNMMRIMDGYESLYQVEEALGHYQEALYYYRLFRDERDSMHEKSTTDQLLRVKDEFQSEKKDKEIELLNQEKIIHTLSLKKQKAAKNFLIASLVLILILSYFIYRAYRAKQEVKLLTLRHKIASDLHDDVGSTLSSISMFSQMAQAQSKEVIPALETIGESSRKMLDAMSDIVWTIKPENDEFDKVVMRMREFAFDLLGAKEIDFEFEANDDISKINLPMEARKNLYLIFKEATNNMVKYSEANRGKFALKAENDKLMMVISDNGKGFDTTKASRGNGLVNMKKRAVEMGAQLLIDSTPGSGTSIRLELAV